MTSVWREFYLNWEIICFALSLRKSASAKSLTVSHTVPTSKFLYLFPPRNSRQLSNSCSGLWSYCHQLTTAQTFSQPFYSHCFLLSPNSSGSWIPTPTEFNRAQWKVDKVNPRSCLKDASLTAQYIPGTCWTPFWNCGYREPSSKKENTVSRRRNT